jgi:DNA-binding response OmpR family regulator
MVVDDNFEIADLIEKLLSTEGYQVLKAYSGVEALEKFEKDICLLILDVMMPGMDGHEVCRQIRSRSNVPILFLSAKGTDIDKVIGLSVGGDDYLVKPFSDIELIARVKALIRRYQFAMPVNESKNVIQIENCLTIDLDAYIVTKYGEIVSVTKTEFDILSLLARNRGRVFNSEEIFQKVWKEKYFEGNNTVMVHLARLRDKIEDDPKKAQIIKNVWGVGYKIDA